MPDKCIGASHSYSSVLGRKKWMAHRHYGASHKYNRRLGKHTSFLDGCSGTSNVHNRTQDRNSGMSSIHVSASDIVLRQKQ